MGATSRSSAYVIAALSLLLVMVAASRASAAPVGLGNTPATTYVTNGPVDALARSGNTLYLGGSFSQVGPRTGPAVALSPSTGALAKPAPQIAGHGVEINAMVPDGHGGYFVGGNFNYLSASPGAAPSAHAELAHITSAGTLDTAFAPTLNGRVLALALSGGTLFAGGAFTTVDGVHRRFLVALNTATGAVVNGFQPAPNNDVVALALSPDKSKLYAGGAFSQIGGDQNAQFIAELSASTGAANAAFSTGAAPDGTVRTLAAANDGNNVYAGGVFFNIGGQPQSGLAELNASTGVANPAFNASVSGGQVYSLLYTGSELYAGGNFFGIGGKNVDNLAELNPTTGAVRTSGGQPTFAPNPNNGVFALAGVGSTIYAGGDFSSIAGADQSDLAGLNASNGSIVSGFKPAVNNTVFALAADGTRLFAGGAFTSTGSQPQSDLAAINLTTGAPVSTFKPLPGEPVSALAISGDGKTLYAGEPTFDEPVQAFNTADGATAWTSNTGGLGSGDALVLNGANLYVTGGGFSGGFVADLQPSGASAGHPVSGFTTQTLDGEGKALALDATHQKLYAGGIFQNVGSTTTGALAELSATSGALATGFEPKPGAPSGGGAADVRALTLSPDTKTLYAGGLFSGVGSAAAPQNLAAISTSGATATTFNSSTGGGVDALATAPDGSTVYVGGAFGAINHSRPSYLAELDPAGNLSASFAPGVDDTVSALLASANTPLLAVGGLFRGTLQAPQQGVALFNLAPPSTPGGGNPPPKAKPAITLTRSGRAKLARSGRKVTLQTGETAHCAATVACTVTIAVSGKKQVKHGHKKRSRHVTLLTRTITVPAGQTVVLSLKLGNGQVAKLRAKTTKKVTETLTGRVAGGETAGAKQPVKTALPPRKRAKGGSTEMSVRRATALACAAGLTALALPGAAAAATPLSCNATAVANAVTAGGSYTFNCNGTIKITAQLVVGPSKTVSLDGSGHTVVIDGSQVSGVETGGIFDDAGALTLTHLTLSNGHAAGQPGTAGTDGSAGTAGTAAGQDTGDDGGDAGDATDAVSSGLDGDTAQGGAIFVESGATLTATGDTFSGDTATGGAGGAGAAGGQGGAGGNGADSFGNPVGGAGGDGGAGGAGSDGGDGGDGLGGAIYNDNGTITVTGSSFSSDLASGGAGGRGGAGGTGGVGGGSGGGTDFNNPNGAGEAGQPGDGGDGGDAGDAGSGGTGIGGGVYNGGTMTISSDSFTGDIARGGGGGGGGHGGAGGAGGGYTGTNPVISTAVSGATGQGGDGGSGGNGGNAFSGGLFSESTDAVVSTTFTGDAAHAGGGGALCKDAACSGAAGSNGGAGKPAGASGSAGSAGTAAGDGFYSTALIQSGSSQGPGGSPPPTAQAPVVTGLKVSPKTSHRKHPPTITYTDTAAATATLVIEAQRPGVKVGGKCVAHRKHGKRCKRLVVVRHLEHADTAGGQSIKLKKLKPGSYVLTITATDAAGTSAPVTTRFTVKK